MTIWTELLRRSVFRMAVACGVVGRVLIEVASLAFEAFEAPARVIPVPFS